MVFFFIACHKGEETEEMIEQEVKGVVMGGQKPLGEVYPVQVYLV
jgi:hypothetical protein